MLTMTEFISRHDDILSILQVVDDPIYLDEPYVLSITYTYDPNAGPVTENCSGSSLRRTAAAIGSGCRTSFQDRTAASASSSRRRPGSRSSRCAAG